MTLDELLGKLEGVRKTSRGYEAKCPAHHDRTASLGVRETDDKILVTCGAGCATQAVLEVLGLKFSDLYTKSAGYDGRASRGEGERSPVRADPSSTPDATYVYQDEHGNELFQKLRFNLKDGKKKFTQRTMGPNGWLFDLDGVRRVPYRLPELLAGVALGETIYITEGEKDVERLRAEGKTVTCNPEGSNKWPAEYNEYFRGAKTVIIVADKDGPGRSHARAVRNALSGLVGEIHTVEALTGKDASDHLTAGHRVEEFVEVDLVRNYRKLNLFQPVPPVDWVVENVCVGGETTLLIADGGSGKSYFALALSLAVAAGQPFLGQRVKKGRVVYVDEEGSPDLALQRFHEFRATDEQKKQIDYLNATGVDLVNQPDRLIEDIKIASPVLVVIDSHSKVARKARDENSNTELSRVWDEGFLRLSRETRAAVLVIHHTSVSEFGPSRPRGASQIRNSADQVLTMFKDKDTDVMVVYASKPRRMTRTIRFVFDQGMYGTTLKEVS